MSSSDEYESGSDYSSPGSESSSLETDSDDSYVYPWHDPNLDRFSSFDDLSSDDLMSKILDSLPVYDPPNSDSDGEFEYPDPDLYAVQGADLTQEILINEDTSPGTSYLPQDDEVYLNWVDEFELILYPSDFGDIDEPDEKDQDETPTTTDESTEQKAETEVPQPSVSVTPATQETAAVNEAPEEPPATVQRPQSTDQNTKETRSPGERTTRSHKLRQSLSEKKRRGTNGTPSSSMSPTGSRGKSMGRLGDKSSPRHKTPDPSHSQAAVQRSKSQTDSRKKPSRSASPGKSPAPRSDTKRRARERIQEQVDRQMRVGARRKLRVDKKVKVYGETAYIRYIGEIDDPEMPGQVYGVAFAHRTEHGVHDGMGYFECEPGRGLFVRKNVIRPVRKHARRVARFVGNVRAFERDNLLRERRDNRTRRGKAARKLGPREIGRANNYRPEEYQIKEDNRDFLAPRPATKSRSSADVKVRKKAGPRDVGRSNYRPKEFAEVPRSESNTNRTPSPRGPRTASKKLGPRDMRKKRTNSNWRPPNYEIKESGSFLEDRMVRSSSNAQQVRKKAPKKMGPRDYKRNRDGASESPRHIHNEHAARRTRRSSRDRRRRKRRSSSSQQTGSNVVSPRQSGDEVVQDETTD